MMPATICCEGAVELASRSAHIAAGSLIPCRVQIGIEGEHIAHDFPQSGAVILGLWLH
jgi:hypothetical protein